MADLLNILQELWQEREQLDRAIAALERVSGNGLRPKGTQRTRRKMSVAARNKIAAAQRARWAKVKQQSKPTRKIQKATKARSMSSAARKRIAAAQKARWAKLKATAGSERKSA
jgi:hypothetical protein